MQLETDHPSVSKRVELDEKIFPENASLAESDGRAGLRTGDERKTGAAEQVGALHHHPRPDETRFCTGRESDEQRHLDVVEEKSADRAREASPQCGDVLLCRHENVARRLGGAERLVNEAFERLLPAVQPFALERR